MNTIGGIDENTQQPARVLLAGPDTLYFSFEAHVSEAMLARIVVEKEMAVLASHENAVHCPDWLGARVLPNGSKAAIASRLRLKASRSKC